MIQHHMPYANVLAASLQLVWSVHELPMKSDMPAQPRAPARRWKIGIKFCTREHLSVDRMTAARKATKKATMRHPPACWRFFGPLYCCLSASTQLTQHPSLFCFNRSQAVPVIQYCQRELEYPIEAPKAEATTTFCQTPAIATMQTTGMSHATIVFKAARKFKEE